MTPVIYYFNKDKPDLGFEVFEVNFDFFIENNINTMKNRPSKLKSLGFIKNPNRPLDEEEFIRILNDAGSIRSQLLNSTWS